MVLFVLLLKRVHVLAIFVNYEIQQLGVKALDEMNTLSCCDSQQVDTPFNESLVPINEINRMT